MQVVSSARGPLGWATGSAAVLRGICSVLLRHMAYLQLSLSATLAYPLAAH